MPSIARLANYLSSRATTFSDLTDGDNCFILEDNTIELFARIGSNVTLWSGNHVRHRAVIEDVAFLASQIVVSGGVTIGQGCFIAARALALLGQALRVAAADGMRDRLVAHGPGFACGSGP